MEPMTRLFFPAMMAAVSALFLSGCGASSRGTGNQMMLVRESPDTLGYRKLMSRSQEFGDLKVFIDEKGLPDFVAEANSADRNYLIFYYLEKHQAFACRTRSNHQGGVEFAGPYSMTPGELKLLTNVKNEADKQAAAR